MHLTDEEKEMLDGKYGYPVQKSMEILVGLGECYDAERMIPVASAHLLGSLSMGEAGHLFNKEIADRGGKFIIHTDANPISIEPWLWKTLGIGEEDANLQMAIMDTYSRMGLMLANTCTPYLVGHFPRVGEHVAWSESSAVAFANAVLGARTNREGGFSSMASALTGRTPEYGLHLDRNRYGDLEISVQVELKEIHDYGTLGYFAGKISGDRVPVFTGVPPSVSMDALKQLGAAGAASGSVALYHIVGVTPEAPTKEAAFGPRGKKDRQIFQFGEKELRETEASISRTTDREIDFVVFGCPHASISELGEIARLLFGKKIKHGVELWVLTSRIVRNYAERMGYVQTIEAAGARVLSDTCTNSMPRGFLKERGHRIGASSSAKIIYGIGGQQSMLMHYGSTKKCVEAAVSGKWE